MTETMVTMAETTAKLAETTAQAETTSPVQDVVSTVGSEVEQTTSVLYSLFHPFVEKLPALLFALILLGVGVFFVKQVMRIVRRALERSNMDGIMASFLRSIIKIVLYVLLVVVALSVLDVPMDSIVAVIASAGVGVALALKDSLSNLAGGFILLFSKPMKEGDTVEINGSVGKIESISILYTRMVTVDNTVVYVPNGLAASGKIINYTGKELRRVDIPLGISYLDDMERARQALLTELKGMPDVMQEPAPEVVALGHDASAVSMRLQAWTKSENYWPVYYALVERAKTVFDREGISIPYPQMDVHVVDTKEE